MTWTHSEMLSSCRFLHSPKQNWTETNRKLKVSIGLWGIVTSFDIVTSFAVIYILFYGSHLLHNGNSSWVPLTITTFTSAPFLLFFCKTFILAPAYKQLILAGARMRATYSFLLFTSLLFLLLLLRSTETKRPGKGKGLKAVRHHLRGDR